MYCLPLDDLCFLQRDIMIDREVAKEILPVEETLYTMPDGRVVHMFFRGGQFRIYITTPMPTLPESLRVSFF